MKIFLFFIGERLHQTSLLLQLNSFVFLYYLSIPIMHWFDSISLEYENKKKTYLAKKKKEYMIEKKTTLVDHANKKKSK